MICYTNTINDIIYFGIIEERKMLDSIFKWLGITWSVIAFLAVAVFFLGGEWEHWRNVKETVLQLDKVVSHDELNNALSKLGTGKRDDPAFGNAVTAVCPEGSYMIGARFKSDPGGPHGIVSNLFPICREILR